MENLISKERATEIVKAIIEKKEQAKDTKAYITGAKEELEAFMQQNDLTEWSCKYGTVKIADSVRQGLDKEKVESAVTKVNSKEIEKIEISELYKETDVHIISIKANKEEN